MRTRAFLLLLVFGILALSGTAAYGQPKEFQIKRLKHYWRDQNNRPWSDLTCQMAVRIDPQFAKELESDEISVEDPPRSPLKYSTGDWRLFALKRDANGTYADVDYLVYKDSSQPVTYQVELRKGSRPIRFETGSTSRVDVRNDSVQPKAINLGEANAITWKDWAFMGAVVLTGGILIYVLIFRWLFNGLLFRRRWSVPGAEHFTWSMSLLIMLVFSAALTLFYIGMRLETWIIIGVVGVFWLLHGVVWLVSGKQA